MKKSNIINSFKISMNAKSINEGFARSVISSFVCGLDPTIEELCDIKTAVSEAVTNCIVHAYATPSTEAGLIYIDAKYDEKGLLTVKIRDKGCGIENVEKALEPMYTCSKSDERSGMGFSIMQCFTDSMSVKSSVGKGTTVTLKKYISKQTGNE